MNWVRRTLRRRHTHNWRMGWLQGSMEPDYNDRVEGQYCTSKFCNSRRTVYIHKCSNCGHEDKKASLILRGDG